MNKAKCFFLKTLCCLSVHAFGSLNFYLEHSKFNDLLNSIRSKCKSCASWPDPAKAIRASQVNRLKFHFIECCISQLTTLCSCAIDFTLKEPHSN